MKTAFSFWNSRPPNPFLRVKLVQNFSLLNVNGNQELSSILNQKSSLLVKFAPKNKRRPFIRKLCMLTWLYPLISKIVFNIWNSNSRVSFPGLIWSKRKYWPISMIDPVPEIENTHFLQVYQILVILASARVKVFNPYMFLKCKHKILRYCNFLSKEKNYLINFSIYSFSPVMH